MTRFACIVSVFALLFGGCGDGFSGPQIDIDHGPTTSTPHEPSHRGQIPIYDDVDCDGFGRPGVVDYLFPGEELPHGYSFNAKDCNDDDPNIGRNVPWFLDKDQDGWGSSSNEDSLPGKPWIIHRCPGDEPCSDYVSAPGDCDDADPDVYPVAPYPYYRVDRDCDGYLDH